MDRANKGGTRKWFPVPLETDEKYYVEVFKWFVKITTMKSDGKQFICGTFTLEKLDNKKCKQCKFFMICEKIVKEKYVSGKVKRIFEDWNLKQTYECCE